MSDGPNDWNPETYDRFRGLRLRPALDLLAQVGALPSGDVVDLGCGSGAVGEALAARFPDLCRVGVDNSGPMLVKAEATGCYARLERADIGNWAPVTAPALVFSNAALHWLPGHDRLLPKLAGYLAPGGVLAVQMPRQFDEPSHRLLRDIAALMFPARFGFTAYVPPVGTADGYWRMLSPLGQVDVWETDYVQRLDPVNSGHPVRHFTESTAMRPIVEALDADETAAFVAAYDEALGRAYPLLPDGAALFSFRRLFFTLKP